MTTDKNPPSPQPGPDAGIDDTQTGNEQTPNELGETVEALSGNADVNDEVKQKVADTKDRMPEKANEITDAAFEKADAAQSAARGAFARPRWLAQTQCADRGADRVSGRDQHRGVAPPMIQHRRQRTATSAPTPDARAGG